jgi:CheY-like chemotaxis protein
VQWSNALEAGAQRRQSRRFTKSATNAHRLRAWRVHAKRCRQRRVDRQRAVAFEVSAKRLRNVPAASYFIGKSKAVTMIAGVMAMISVVIAEDNELLAKSIGMLLESYGYEVTLAYDGVQALTEAIRARPDAVVLDIGLPAMDGVAVAKSLRETFGYALRLIALTARTDEATRRDIVGAGFDDLLVKPASIYQILNAIRHGGGRAKA